MENSENSSYLPILGYYSLSGPDALSVLRVLGPAELAGLRIVNGVVNGAFNVNAAKDGDIVILQRDISKHYDIFEEIITLARAEGKPVVFDLDDLLFELPENHPDRISGFYVEALLPMLQAVIEADLVTVATEPLKEYLLPYNRKIVVVPNYLNDRLWKLKKIDSAAAKDDTITIGYMGGHSHKPDLLMVVPALKIILEKYPQRIRFHFWGIEPPDELIPFSQVDWCPPPSYEYADFAQYFQTQSADIVIAPLGNNHFNNCKSPIKYLEYSANAMPGVYSRVTPYANIITHGEDGFVAASTEEWVDALSTLIEQKDIRHKFIENAQAKIQKTWLLSKNFHNQVEIYRDLCCGNWAPRKETPTYVDVVKHLASQYHEEFTRINAHGEPSLADLAIKEQTIQTLKNTLNAQIEISEDLKQKNKTLSDQLDDQQLAYKALNQQSMEQQAAIQELTGKMQALEEEVVSYVMSKSWRYTRPLRRINRLFKKVFR